MTIQHLFLGFGGTGAYILTGVKELAVQKNGRKPEHIEFLEFDTIAGWKPGDAVRNSGEDGKRETIAQGEEVSLDAQTEYFQLKDNQPSLLELCSGRLADANLRPRESHLAEWLHSDWLMETMQQSQLNIMDGAAQSRQIGRYAMFANAPRILAELSGRIQRMQNRARDTSVNIWIVGSAAGGTGAGCLIDAAFLVRAALAQVKAKSTITGVIVLPEVYADVFFRPDERSAALARSYSFLRELDRVQYKIGAEGRYSVGATPVQSDVSYQPGTNYQSQVAGKLFDYRVYLSEACPNEDARKAFFSSVASALDAFTDENIGSQLLQDQVNEDGAPIGLGASRLVLPKDTYAERFAWQEVDAFIKAISAPDLAQPNNLLSGAESDRERAATDAVTALLPLFSELLKQSRDLIDQSKISAYAKASLTPRQIVENWFHLATVSAAEYSVNEQDLKTLPKLLYCNPFLSLQKGSDEGVPTTEIAVKTYGEMRAGKDALKENQKQSAERFAGDLLRTRDLYLSPDAGENTFERAFRFVKSLNEARLTRAVDKWISASLSSGGHIAVDETKPGEGTPITRLEREIALLLSPRGGALGKIRDLVDKFKKALTDESQSNRLQQNATDSIAVLNGPPPRHLPMMTWVDSPQKAARDDMQAYVQSLQKERLIDEIKRLTDMAADRLTKWQRALRSSLFDELVVGGPDQDAVLTRIQQRLNTLDKRLGRMANNGSLIISLSSNDGKMDTTMDGYEDVLRRMTRINDRPLHEDWLAKARWEMSVDRGGNPSTRLKVQGVEENGADGHKALFVRLYDEIRKEINVKLANVGILNYLQYVRRLPGGGVDVGTIIGKLRERMRVRLTTDGAGAVQTLRLIYNAGSYADKEMVNLAKSLSDALVTQDGSVDRKDPSTGYSDTNSMILFGSTDPDGITTKIADVARCAEDYLKSYTRFTGVPAYKTLTNHIFRAEEEAWFIERSAELAGGGSFGTIDQVTPPRIVRLLEKPAMMRGFVHCLATKAIYRDDETSTWWFKPKEGDRIQLTDVGDDLLRAAVVFVLQQRTSAQVLSRFTPAMATDAAAAAALANGAESYPKALQAVLSDMTYVSSLISNQFEAPQRASIGTDEHRLGILRQEAEALRRIFRFYLPYASSTDLSKRKI